MERLQEELDELKQDYDELADRHIGLQDDNDDLQTKHDELATDITKYQNELNAHKEENERLRLRDCAIVTEGDEIVEPDYPSFLEEEPEEEEPEEEEIVKELDQEETESASTGTTGGAKKSWGGRGKFSKGSAMRVENKAFIKNQLEKEDYINRDADYYHGGEHYYSTDYNSYYTPVTKRRSKEDRSFNTFTCSTFDYDCTPCESDDHHEEA